jgi:hypothetical protein
LVIAAMSLAAEVLKPLALAVLLSFALAPLAGFFERSRAPPGEEEPGRANCKPVSPPFEVAGVAASGTSDALALRMPGQLVARSKCRLVNLEDADSPMQLADRVAAKSPPMVVLSHLPPEASVQARYQVRRLRARFAGLPILVGRWGEASSDEGSHGVSGVGATHVAFTLADACDQILARAASADAVTATLATATSA